MNVAAPGFLGSGREREAVEQHLFHQDLGWDTSLLTATSPGHFFFLLFFSDTRSAFPKSKSPLAFQQLLPSHYPPTHTHTHSHTYSALGRGLEGDSGTSKETFSHCQHHFSGSYDFPQLTGEQGWEDTKARKRATLAHLLLPCSLSILYYEMKNRVVEVCEGDHSPQWHGVIMLRVFASPLVTQMEIHPSKQSFPAWFNAPGSVWALLSWSWSMLRLTTYTCMVVQEEISSVFHWVGNY